MAEPARPSEKTRSYTAEALRLLRRLQELRNLPAFPDGYSEEIKKIQERLGLLRHRGAGPAAWDVVQLARHQDRPQTLDYIAHILPDFMELSGDRLRGDDSAIVGGLGTLWDQANSPGRAPEGPHPRRTAGAELRHGPAGRLP